MSLGSTESSDQWNPGRPGAAARRGESAAIMGSGEGVVITELQCNDSFHARDSVHGICSSFNSCNEVVTRDIELTCVMMRTRNTFTIDN